MNNKYLIALDLDGTLLKDDKTISKATKDYLRKLEKDGNLIVITSGRALRSVLEYYQDKILVYLLLLLSLITVTTQLILI